jgi:O-antigen/teichoic acid export membrane protein
MYLAQRTIKLIAQSALFSLWKNFSWTFLGNLIYVSCQWGMLMAIAKLGDPEMVGQFALGLAITAPIVLFANLGLRQVQATDTTHHYSFGDYFGLRLITTSLALVGIVLISLVAGYGPETGLVILIVGLAKAFESLSDVFYGRLQQRERMDLIAKSMMIKGFLSLAMLSVSIYVTRSILWGVVSVAAAWASVFFFYDLLVNRSVNTYEKPANSYLALLPRFRTSLLTRLAWLSLPLGIVATLMSLNTGIPRYLMEFYLGERELGIFGAMAYTVVAGNVVVGALGHSSSPRLARYYASGDNQRYFALLFGMIGMGVLLGLVGVLVSVVAGRWLLTLLYTPEYAEHADAFVWIMIAGAVSYGASLGGFGIVAARYFRLRIPLLVSTVVATLFASMVLIPKMGILGGAVGMTIGMGVQSVGVATVLLFVRRVNQKRT